MIVKNIYIVLEKIVINVTHIFICKYIFYDLSVYMHTYIHTDILHAVISYLPAGWGN